MLGSAFVATAALFGCTTSQTDQLPATLAAGKQIYSENCAACHGDAGNGKGPAAYLLFPKPRNFQRAEFKLRSTPQGMLPTDEDLLKTVSQGIPGTGMFAFNQFLSPDQVRAVVDYVKFLTPAFKEAAPITPDQLLKISAAPEPSAALVAEGKVMYDKFGCDKCHGPQGRGDGPSAPTLIDSSGDPFPAADFSFGVYKSGGQPAELYRTFLTGMAGTPMPSYQTAITNDREAWALVYYTLSLAPGGKAKPIAGDDQPLEIIDTANAADLTNPDAEVWDKISPASVYLRPLWYRNNYPIFVKVRAARTGERLGVMLEWDDATHDSSVGNEQSFADGVAMQFALGDKLPFIAMGNPTAQGVCEIWHWRADRQLSADTGKPAVRTDTYPNMFKDTFAHEPQRHSARDAGNVLAAPESADSPAHALSAAGMGTLTARPGANRVDSRGRWKNGTYRVAFSAPLTPTDADIEADFTRARIPVAFAIWDGHSGDRNGTKLVSQWLFMAPQGTIKMTDRRTQ